MTDYRLVTYQCLHFKIIAEHSLSPDEKKEDSSLQGLSTKPTSSQRHSKFRCGSPTCKSITEEEWLWRIKDALDHCKQHFSTSSELYVDAAHRYHSTPICIRAMTFKDNLCLAAHQQFGIEKRFWDGDPFFQDWQDALETVMSIEQALSVNVDEGSVADAVTAVNLIRTVISRVEGKLGKVIDGAFAVQNKQREEEEKGDWGKRERSRVRSAGYFPPVGLFSRVVYEVWERRMEGFWHSFHVK